MSRLKLLLLNRCKLLQFATFVVAVTTLLWGIDVTTVRAETTPADPLHPYAIRDPKVDPNLSPAQRARVQRDAAATKRKAARKFVKDVAEGKQPAASDKKDTGGDK